MKWCLVEVDLAKKIEVKVNSDGRRSRAALKKLSAKTKFINNYNKRRVNKFWWIEHESRRELPPITIWQKTYVRMFARLIGFVGVNRLAPNFVHMIITLLQMHWGLWQVQWKNYFLHLLQIKYRTKAFWNCSIKPAKWETSLKYFPLTGYMCAIDVKKFINICKGICNAERIERSFEIIFSIKFRKKASKKYDASKRISTRNELRYGKP